MEHFITKVPEVHKYLLIIITIIIYYTIFIFTMYAKPLNIIFVSTFITTILKFYYFFMNL